EVVFHKATTGASNDLERATEIARKMVMEFGMSDDLGPMTFGEREELVFLGRSIAEHRNYSEAVARRIDQQVREIIHQAHSRALEVMTTYRDLLDKLAQQLIQKETLEEAEVEALMSS
ncbi:MAG TPA: cell division protein FtsH, partial [Anaerolineae bacterium]|nr:cell division protein FtsH [Anaerolineae bacterium]